MKTIKKIGLLFLMILSFISGLLIGKSYPTKTNALYYDNGQYVSSNIGYFEYYDNLIETIYEDVTAFYFDSQGAGLYLFNEDLEFNLLQTYESYPEIYYYTFEYDNADNFPYIYIEWDNDYGTIEYLPNEDESGTYTLSFMVDYVSYNQYERYYLYNFMLNKGNYIEYEPPGKIFGTNHDIGMFKYANLKRGIFEDINTINFIETLPYTPVYSGFMAKNWDYDYGRVDYAIIADFGVNGFIFDNYNSLLLLNGNASTYTTSFRYGQQIYILFEHGLYYINGADLSYEKLASVDLKSLRAEYGRIIYKIIFVGYGEDYIPGGLATDTFYTSGYNDGFTAGETNGFYKGYESGTQAGYDRGFIDGEAVGITQSNKALGVARSVLGFVTDFTSIEILPNIRIIYLLGLVVMVGIFKWITGLFK